MSLRNIGLFALVSIGISSTAGADSIEENKNREEQQHRVEGLMREVNAKCKSTIPDRDVIDWATWKQARDGGHLAVAFCVAGRARTLQKTLEKVL